MSVKYIKETDEFIVDGKTVRASSLTEDEKKKFMESASNASLLIGSNKKTDKVLI